MHLGSNVTALQLLASGQNTANLEFRTLTHYASHQLHQLVENYLAIKNTQNSNQQPIYTLIRTGKSDLLSLKRKLSQKFEEQCKLYDTLNKRLHHQPEPKVYNDPEKQEEFNLQVLQYFHSRCKFPLVKDVAQSFSYQELVGLQTTLLRQAENIMREIRMNYLASLLNWMERNHHQLQKLNLVYFQLMICQFLNILSEGRNLDAVTLIRNTVSKLRPSQAQEKIISDMTYFLADMESNPPDFKFYLKMLEDAFLKAFSEIYQINFDDMLRRDVSLGISAKQTICCLPTSNRRIYDCPICAEKPQKLSANIPRLTPQTSILKCRINKSTMDHENYPVALPSGQIYSISGLKSMSIDNKFYCLITQTWYNKEDAVKVYLT